MHESLMNLCFFFADSWLEKMSQGRMHNAEGYLEILSGSRQHFCSSFRQTLFERQCKFSFAVMYVYRTAWQASNIQEICCSMIWKLRAFLPRPTLFPSGLQSRTRMNIWNGSISHKIVVNCSTHESPFTKRWIEILIPTSDRSTSSWALCPVWWWRPSRCSMKILTTAKNLSLTAPLRTLLPRPWVKLMRCLSQSLIPSMDQSCSSKLRYRWRQATWYGFSKCVEDLKDLILENGIL